MALKNKKNKLNGNHINDPEQIEYLESAEWEEWKTIEDLPPDDDEAIAHEARKILNYPIYCDLTDRFYVYNGKYWKYTLTAKINRQCVRALDRGRPGKKGHVRTAQNEISGRLKLKGAIRDDRAMNDRVNYINTSGGTLCINKWILGSHRKTDLCTSIIDVELNQEMIEKIKTQPTTELLDEAPKFKKFLMTTFKGYVDPMKTIQYVQEIIGYTFAPHCHAHKGFFFIGDGRNGKGVLCNIIAGLVGSESITHINFGDLTNDTKIALMADKKVNICNDADAIRFSDRKSSDKFKAITAGDPITYRDVYEKAQNVRFLAKLIFALNHMPEIRDNSYGFLSRISALPFKNEMKEEDQIKDLAQQIIKEELKPIALFALQGLWRLKNRDYCFRPCEDSNQETNEYKNMIDPFDDFMKTKIIINEKAKISCNVFQTLFYEYLKATNTNREYSTTDIGKDLHKYMKKIKCNFFKRKPNHNGRENYYIGIGESPIKSTD